MPTYNEADQSIVNAQTYNEDVVLAAAGIVFTNTDTGRVFGQFRFEKAGSQLINENGGYIGAPDGTNEGTYLAIAGSSGADTIWDYGNIQGLVSLGDGDDVLISNSATSTYATTQYGADMGSGDDLLRFEDVSTLTFFSPYGDGGEGTDTIEFAASTLQLGQIDGQHLSGFEILSLQVGGTYYFFSGYDQIVGASGLTNSVFHLVGCNNPLVDLALDGSRWALSDSVFASVSGGDANDDVYLSGSTQVSNDISMGAGADRFGISSSTSVTSLGVHIDGGVGEDEFAIGLVSETFADSMANVTGFELLNIFNSTAGDNKSIQLSEVSGFSNIVVGNGLALILSSGDLTTASVSGAFAGSVEIAAGVTIANYVYTRWVQNIDTDLTQANDLNSTVFTNQGTVLGDVIFYDGHDHYDGTLGSAGTVHGNAGDDLIEGGVNAEVLHGDAGSDTIYGHGGNDELYGGSEDDILDGGEGIDTLTGGTGADYFVYTSFNDAPTGGQLDRIADFEVGIDKIDLSALAISSLTIETSDTGYILTAFGPEGAMAIQIDSVVGFSEADVIFGASNSAPTLDNPLLDHHSDEDAAINLVLPADTFGDVDGDALTWSAQLVGGATLPTWLSFDPALRSFSGTPPQDFNGSFEIEVVVSDGEYSVNDTFVLTIDPQNDAPTANDEAVSVDEDAVVTGNILANDGDIDGDSVLLLNVEGNSLPTIIAGSFGTLTISADGQYSYEANADIVDTLAPGTVVTDTFAYTISDGSLSDSATLTVNVTAINDGVTVDATNGSTDITGTAGDDILIGGGGKESIWGGDGFDQLSGDNGNDTLDGGAGIDLLDGGKGNDVLIGGDGDDLLIGGRGHDYFEGGPGADIFMFEEATRSTGSDVIADFSVGKDAIYLVDGLEIVSIVEASGDTTLSLSNGGEIVLSGVAGIPDADTVLTDTLPTWFNDADVGQISLLAEQSSQFLDTGAKVSEPTLVHEILGELAASTEMDELIGAITGDEPETLHTLDGHADPSTLLDFVFEGQNEGMSLSFDLPADLTMAESLQSAGA